MTKSLGGTIQGLGEGTAEDVGYQSFLRKTFSDGTDVTFCGRVFHSLVPKYLLPEINERFQTAPSLNAQQRRPYVSCHRSNPVRSAPLHFRRRTRDEEPRRDESAASRSSAL